MVAHPSEDRPAGPLEGQRTGENDLPSPVRRPPASGQLAVARGGDERAWQHGAAAGQAEPFWRIAPGSCRADVDPDAWPVGFSPTGEALPDALTDVLLRGSHWVRSAERAEAERRERSAAVAAHVDAQLRAFLDLCSQADLVPPVTMRVGRDVPRLARARHRSEGRPRAALRTADDRAIPLTAPTADAPDRLRRAGGAPGPRRSERGPDVDPPAGREDRPRRSGRKQRGAESHRAAGDRPDSAAVPRQAGGPAGHRPGRKLLSAWPVLYWRCESFPSAGRSLHLFVEPGGRTFEGRELPAPLTVVGRQVRVWPVDAPSIVEGMAEVDARRCALHLVDGMARLLWRAGVGL